MACIEHVKLATGMLAERETCHQILTSPHKFNMFAIYMSLDLVIYMLVSMGSPSSTSMMRIVEHRDRLNH